jgi:SAM-dependent methyltransferase
MLNALRTRFAPKGKEPPFFEPATIATQCFTVPLIPLIELPPSPSTEGTTIWLPEQDQGTDKVGITEQFLENAETYHSRYFQPQTHKALLSRVFDQISFAPAPPALTILDIGSGSGNSVFACLDLFPQSRIVATDLSPDMLCIMARYAKQFEGDRKRVFAVCMDATSPYFQAGAFDLVIGGAILHHLLKPESAIASVSHALKPGGVAIFFEPFQAGYSIVRLAYSEIIQRAEAGAAIDPVALDVLKRIHFDLQTRMFTDPADPIYQHLDDKWLFTRSFFEQHAKAVGLREVTVFSPTDPHTRKAAFTRQTQINLKLAAQLEAEALPDWAWEILDTYDRAFTEELKQELLLDGCVVFRR